MKKFLMSLVVVCLAFVLTGCGDTNTNINTLTCSMSESEEGIESYTEIKVGFSGDEVDTVNINAIATLDDEYSEYLDFFEAVFRSEFESIMEDIGDMDVTRDDNSLSMSLSINVSDLTDGEKEDMELINADRETIKAELEDEGYTCN